METLADGCYLHHIYQQSLLSKLKFLLSAVSLHSSWSPYLIFEEWFHFEFNIFFDHLQLQLQRNEVIALMNLLNRLSESVKFVHEMGPTAERIIERQFYAHATLIRSLKGIWSSVLKNIGKICFLGWAFVVLLFNVIALFILMRKHGMFFKQAAIEEIPVFF